jgi:hypothetical protein
VAFNSPLKKEWMVELGTRMSDNQGGKAESQSRSDAAMKAFPLLLGLLFACTTVLADAPQTLEEIETEIKADPDNPDLHYRKCKVLFASGKQQEAIDHSAVALEKYKRAGKELAWMQLGSIKAGKYLLAVHYNMGPDERADKKDGIVRPYSFRVYSTGDSPRLVQTIDFELGYFDGKLLTAAIGETTAEGHGNYGIVDPKSKFATIRDKVIKLIEDKK